MIFLLEREENTVNEEGLRYRELWSTKGKWNLPSSLSYTAEEGEVRSRVVADVTTYVQEFICRVIIGETPLNDDMSVLTSTKGPMHWEKSDAPYTLSFTNTDSIIDFLLSVNMKPFLELGFLPEVLTSGQTTVFHYKGHTSPPDDWDAWAWLVEEFTARRSNTKSNTKNVKGRRHTLVCQRPFRVQIHGISNFSEG